MIGNRSDNLAIYLRNKKRDQYMCPVINLELDRPGNVSPSRPARKEVK
jgi:hypothetical protein